MRFEKLDMKKYEENSSSFYRCQNEWIEISLEELYEEYKKCEEFIKNMEDYEEPIVEMEYVIEVLKGGGLVTLLSFIAREKNDKPKCPNCGRAYIAGTESISKKDNKTKICPSCEIGELLGNFND